MNVRAYDRWEGGLDAEVAFWENWIATRGGAWPDDYARRMDPAAPLVPLVEAEVARAAGRKVVSILEVGCGPVSGMGHVTATGRQLSIVYTDPLTDEYARLWCDAGIPQPHPIRRIPAEGLRRFFRLDTFDIVYARNCLDHGNDPPRAVIDCCLVTRPGGAVILEHKVNEGHVENYHGLHQWNLFPGDGELWCEDREDEEVSVSRLALPLAETERIESDGTWFTVVFRRH